MAAHERALAELLDRSSFVMVVKDAELKAQAETVRNHWRSQAPKREQAGPAVAAGAAGGAPAVADAPMAVQHPLGSQRALMHRFLFEALNKEVAQDHPAKQACDKLSKLPAAEADSYIFRMRPRHDKPAENKPWVFAFLLSDTVPADYKQALDACKQVKCDKLFVAGQRSQDGPTIKWLLDLRKGFLEADTKRQRV